MFYSVNIVIFLNIISILFQVNLIEIYQKRKEKKLKEENLRGYKLCNIKNLSLKNFLFILQILIINI